MAHANRIIGIRGSPEPFTRFTLSANPASDSAADRTVAVHAVQRNLPLLLVTDRMCQDP